ncbi:hypothetical protein [Ralstonia solanacearum]|uniref:hypothetical protein n=1 Tax=Ralstonia solanacearum TaxID=305 RepID=UPI000AD03B09|nr:hypothetical protein [Ralstonia solanacearum]
MTEAEIDEHIAALKEDLDAVASKAKRALRTAEEETLQIVSSKHSDGGSNSNKS